MVKPEQVAVVAVISAVFGVGSYLAYRLADQIGPELQPGDLLPAAPWEGPPFPRFMVRKPAMIKEAIEKD